MVPLQEKLIHSFWEVLYWMFHDWTVHLPLMILSFILLILLPIWSRYRRNAFLLLVLILLPVTGIYLSCKLMNINHFISSRYFINFLPIFIISLYLSLSAIELKFERLRRFLRPNLPFLILFITSNLVILPFYYQSEKLNLRALVNYLKGDLKEGDIIFDATTGMGLMPGMLHYFGTYPKGRQYVYVVQEYSDNEIEFFKAFTYQDKQFTIYHSSSCCYQYIKGGNRLWFIADKLTAEKLKNIPPFIPKGFFDGSFLNYYKFPFDASVYLFLLDPKSPNQEGIDVPIDLFK